MRGIYAPQRGRTTPTRSRTWSRTSSEPSGQGTGLTWTAPAGRDSPWSASEARDMALSSGTKIGLGLVVAGAITFLVLSDTGEGVLEYVYVDKVVTEPAQFQGRMIKVHGYVVEESIQKKKNS